ARLNRSPRAELAPTLPLGRRGPCRGFGERRRVPNPYGVVRRAAREEMAVWAERHTSNRVIMPLQGKDFYVRVQVPQAYRVVIVSARQALALGMEGHAPNRKVAG